MKKELRRNEDTFLRSSFGYSWNSSLSVEMVEVSIYRGQSTYLLPKAE